LGLQAQRKTLQEYPETGKKLECNESKNKKTDEGGRKADLTPSKISRERLPLVGDEDKSK